MSIEGESLNGAFQQMGKQLTQQWKGKDSFAILLSDFKHGHAFLDIFQLWQLDDTHSQRLHCIAFVGNHFSCPPLTSSTLASSEDSTELESLIAELSQKWPLPIASFHRIYLKNNSVMLTLVLGEFESQLFEVSGPIDVFVLNHDGEDLHLQSLKQIWRLSQANSTILSLSSSQTSQDLLVKTGFLPQRHSSPQGSFLTATIQRPPRTQLQCPTTKEAIIIGAGIAGCALANSLAQRGWKIRLIDSQAQIASQASGNHIGLCHPTFSLDDNFQARLSRAGFFTTQQKIEILHHKQPVHFGMDGHFQIAKDSEAAELMQAILKEQRLPEALVRWLGVQQAISQLNIECEFGGWWLPQGMWINPASSCNGYINECSDNIDLSLNTYIERIDCNASVWHLYDRENRLIASTETLILANAHDATRLLPNTDLALSSSLRSVTRLPANQLETTSAGISGSTYLTAEFDGWRCAGANLVRSNENELEVEASNLNDLANLIGASALLNTAGAQTRQCVRPNSADRLPLVGAVPDTQPISHSVHQLFHIPKAAGLFAVLGFGSRGLTWHALSAEVLACQLNDEPQGIERSLINAIDPSRFVLRRLRKLSSQKKP